MSKPWTIRVHLSSIEGSESFVDIHPGEDGYIHMGIGLKDEEGETIGIELRMTANMTGDLCHALEEAVAHLNA